MAVNLDLVRPRVLRVRGRLGRKLVLIDIEVLEHFVGTHHHRFANRLLPLQGDPFGELWTKVGVCIEGIGDGEGGVYTEMVTLFALYQVHYSVLSMNSKVIRMLVV